MIHTRVSVKRPLSALAIILIYMMHPVMAQTTSSTIGGNVAGITTNPVNRQAYYSVTEYIWTKAQLNAAGINAVVNLSGMQFEKTGGATGTTNNATNNTPGIKVYIKSIPLTTTTLTSALWSTSGYTQVFDGTYIHSGAYGWKQITFSTPFNWDNNSNIQVLITNESNVLLNSTDRPSWRYGQYTTANDGDLASQCRFGTTATAGGGLPTGISLTGNKASVRFVYAAGCTPPSNPSFSAGPLSLCAGATATYTASATNGNSTTYAIQGGGASINSTTGVVSNVTSNFTVRANITNTCGNVTVDRAVTVNAAPAASIAPASASICQGGSVTLTASGGSSYNWSNSLGTGAAKTVSPSSTTTYTVTATDANNCTATASRQVVVNTAPVATISPASVSVCAGSTATLTAGGGSSYSWSNGLGSGATQNVSPATTTIYTVTVTDANSCTATASRQVTVNQPSSSTLNNAICQGSTFFFNNQNLTQAGVYLDTLINVAGCDSIVTLNLSVNSVSSSTIAQTICSGSSYAFNGQNLTQSGTYTANLVNAAGCDSTVTLNLTVSSAIQTNLSESICTGDTFAFNGQQLTQSGTYTANFTTTNGCDSVVALNLAVQPLPQPVVVQNGNVLSTGSFEGYQWYLNGQAIANETDSSIIATQNGNYSVAVTDANGCIATSDEFAYFTVGAISNSAENPIRIYPNPAADKVYIENIQPMCNVFIVNSMGQIIDAFENATPTRKSVELGVQTLPGGLYMVRVTDKRGGFQQIKLIVK